MEMGAYFISRMPSNVKIYLNSDDKEELDLAMHIDRKCKGYDVIDITVFIGAQERLPVRLVAYRMPEDIINKRLREANKRAKDTGRDMSKPKRELLRFTILITNVPKDMLDATVIGTVYRLRWEIELVFKMWKQELKVSVLKGVDKNRIEGLLWGRLCFVLLLSLINSWLMDIAWARYGRELSPTKLIRYLMGKSRLLLALETDQLEKLLTHIVRDILKRLLKDKRKRKTMLGKVITLEPYHDLSLAV
jgi:hypothetical protein